MRCRFSGRSGRNGRSTPAAGLSARLPAFTPAVGPRRGSVALVAGCVQRAYFPDVNAATVRVLAAEGFDVLVPAGQGCWARSAADPSRL